MANHANLYIVKKSLIDDKRNEILTECDSLDYYEDIWVDNKRMFISSFLDNENEYHKSLTRDNKYDLIRYPSFLFIMDEAFRITDRPPLNQLEYYILTSDVINWILDCGDFMNENDLDDDRTLALIEEMRKVDQNEYYFVYYFG